MAAIAGGRAAHAITQFVQPGRLLERLYLSTMVLELAFQPGKQLESLTVRALANEVVIGLMAATLVRQ